MNRYEINRLKNRFKETLKEEGMVYSFKKAISYISSRLKSNGGKLRFKNSFVDVLFINGCYLDHPHRYRVLHQIEQLESFNIKCKEIFYLDINKTKPKYFRFIIIFRCPHTPDIENFIKSAQKLNKKVYFDIDDLVIDTKYTDNIPYIKSMPSIDKKAYDDGVNRMGQTLKLCDGAITTTEALAAELKKYVKNVYINRNAISDAMFSFSEKAIYYRDVLTHMVKSDVSRRLRKRYNIEVKALKQKQNYIDIGYFSGSITHNDDVNIVIKPIATILKKFNNVRFCFMGILDIPSELKQFEDRVVTYPFCDWHKLPYYISKVDINIVPLVDSIFNRCKSENKWVEASFVKVPTIASNVGAFKTSVVNNKTGILCENNENSWVEALSMLIENKDVRRQFGENAYKFVTEHYLTYKTGLNLSNIINNNITKNIAFVLPSISTSGGILVALKHAETLQNFGYDVFAIADGKYNETGFVQHENCTIPVISTSKTYLCGRIDKLCATLWSTNKFCSKYANKGEHLYLVQNFETDFYKYPSNCRIDANSTYSLKNIKYITVSKWCEDWLINKYNSKPLYIPNCVDAKFLDFKKRLFNGKIRILIEGNSNDYYKNVDESFKITNMLDKNKYEVWYISYQGYPKKWYRYDRFLHNVPHDQMPAVYRDCHILLKTSILESFSYPPLEMMATGGFCVVRKNNGNVEYLKHEYNCLFYDENNPLDAIKQIERIVKDTNLRSTLELNGSNTAKMRDWSKINNLIVKTYFNNL